jgi:hypothetical protein
LTLGQPLAIRRTTKAEAGDKVEYHVAVFNERPRAKDVRVLKRAWGLRRALFREPGYDSSPLLNPRIIPD